MLEHSDDDVLERRGAPLPSPEITGSRLSAEDIKPGEKIRYPDQEVEHYGGWDGTPGVGRRRRALGSRPARSA
jgi:hypothetical protein